MTRMGVWLVLTAMVLPATTAWGQEAAAADPQETSAEATAETTAEGGTAADAEAALEEMAPEERRVEAEDHFNRGLALMQGENWDGAYLEFERSIELFPTRSALFNLAMCQKALFHYVESLRSFQRFLEVYRDQADQAQLQSVAEVIRELNALLTDMVIEVNVAGAEIYLDGDLVGTAPLAEAVQVGAGTHTVEARLDGYISAQQTLPVVLGERPTVALALQEVARVGRLRVEANVPGAEVWVDGEHAGTAPYSGTLPEGEHELRVSAEGYEEQVQTVAVATGDERIVTVALSLPSGTDPAWFWSMVGLTGAATVATAALGAVVLIKDEDYANDENRTVEMQDEGKQFVVATDVCLGVAIAAAITATVLGFTTNWGGEESPPEDGEPFADVTATLGAGPDGLGLAVVGRF
ncbi:MAG: PEGA domain-containing protein [Deltaproteobacteria bacterium]|nr:PEGA domain-containing protein [Deltaproteobacteria bacterium]